MTDADTEQLIRHLSIRAGLFLLIDNKPNGRKYRLFEKSKSHTTKKMTAKETLVYLEGFIRGRYHA